MKMLFLLLALTGCSMLQKSPELSGSSKEVPEWIYSPYEACDESGELCATGEAKTMASADAQARANLASIFEVQVKSTLNSNQSSKSSYPWQSQVNEEVQTALEESVDEILENVQVKKHFKKDGLTYALASLDKSQAAELISGRMKRLDTELETLWQRRSRTNLRKIMRLHLEREKLNERYATVAGGKRAAKPSYEEIMRWKDSRPEMLPISLKVGQAPEWMTEKIKELLSESGFKIVKGESHRVLSMNVDSIKEFLNVDGFEKYTFTLNMTSTENGEKKKVISTSETVTGRTQADALLKVKPFFNTYIEEHLSDLHLD
jgi:hypothetical protein